MTRAPIFADSGYFFALTNTNDRFHKAAAKWAHQLVIEPRPLVTTSAVLTELGDGFAKANVWARFGPIVDAVRLDPKFTVVHVDPIIFDAAYRLRAERKDKDWGLTDCASFIVMRAHAISEALACDSDFSQAGFRALLLEK